MTLAKEDAASRIANDAAISETIAREQFEAAMEMRYAGFANIVVGKTTEPDNDIVFDEEKSLPGNATSVRRILENQHQSTNEIATIDSDIQKIEPPQKRQIPKQFYASCAVTGGPIRKGESYRNRRVDPVQYKKIVDRINAKRKPK
jgi:hypothetical protein